MLPLTMGTERRPSTWPPTLPSHCQSVPSLLVLEGNFCLGDNDLPMNMFYYPEGSAPTRELWLLSGTLWTVPSAQAGKTQIEAARQPPLLPAEAQGPHTGFRPSHWPQSLGHKLNAHKPFPSQKTHLHCQGDLEDLRCCTDPACSEVLGAKGAGRCGLHVCEQKAGRAEQGASVSQKQSSGKRASAQAALTEAVCPPVGSCVSTQPRRREKEPSRGLQRARQPSSPLQPGHSSTSQMRTPNAPAR